MAEAATQLPSAPSDWPTYNSSSSNDASNALGYDDSKMKEVTGKLADIKRNEMAANDKAYGQLENTASKDIPKLEQMSKDAGVEAGKLKPWNEEAEAKKRESDPIQNFASLGSVFGILASAFTHAPMMSAMDASAAAINAIKAGNPEDYNRAYKAWEANTKQALDRHKIEHEAFQDAASLMKVNMEAANTKLRVNAARFGSQRDLVLIENGMTKELMDYKASMQKLAEDMTKNMVPMAEANAEMAVLINHGYKPNAKTPEELQKNTEALKALAEYNAQMSELTKDPTITGEEGRLIREYATTKKPDGTLPTADDRKNFIKDLRTVKQSTPAQIALQTYMEEHPNASAEDIKNFIATLPGAGGKSSRVPKPEEEAVRARAKELEDGGMSKSQAIEQAQHEFKVKTAAPSGNRVDDLKSRENKIDVIETNINHLDDMLLKHKAISGIGGKITRTGEAIGNILGSSQTDRAQFRRWVLEIQETLPTVLNDRNGRPISSEAEKVEGIVAGLAAGDTNANTLRAYDELRPLLKTLKRQLQERRGAVDEKPTTETKSSAPWDNDPVVGAQK